MSFEECVRKGIGIAYVSEGHSPFQNVLYGTDVNFHHEGGKMIDEGIKHNTILNSGCSTLLLRNLDFDDLYSASLKEEEEEVEENKPVLTHLEEIAEMNERLRAKLIREMNMSDRSLMNDSPICIDVETPISEVQQDVSPSQISDETRTPKKPSSKPSKPKVTRRQTLKKEPEPSVSRDDSSEDDWADSKPVSVVQNQETSKEDDWDDAKPIIVQSATKNSNSTSKDDSDWEDSKEVRIVAPLSIQPKPTSRRRRKGAMQSKPMVQPEWSDDEWESAKVNNKTSLSIKKETSRKKKIPSKPVTTKDDWNDSDWEDSRVLTTQKEEKQKEIEVNSTQKEEDWEDSKPIPVPTNTTDTKTISNPIKANAWTDDEDWEDSKPVVITVKTVDSEPVPNVAMEDDWEDSKPVTIATKKDDGKSFSNHTKADDWTDDEEDWEDSKPVVTSLKKVDTKTLSNSTIVSNDADREKTIDVKPDRVTLKADTWSDEGDIWEDTKPVPVVVVKDEQSKPVTTPTKPDTWSDEGDIWEDTKPVPSPSKKTDDWSDEGDIWGDPHSSSNKREDEWETIVSPLTNEESQVKNSEKMDWSDDEVKKMKMDSVQPVVKQDDDMWEDSKPVNQETTSTPIQTIRPANPGKSRRSRRRRGSLNIKIPDESDEEREKSRQVIIKKEMNTEHDDWSDEEEWKSSKPVVNTNQKRVDDIINSIPDFSFLGLSGIE